MRSTWPPTTSTARSRARRPAITAMSGTEISSEATGRQRMLLVVKSSATYRPSATASLADSAGGIQAAADVM